MKHRLTDQYASFTELSKNKQKGIDYTVFSRVSESGLLVMAPHGGGIEPGISEIVRCLASDFSVYLLEGLKRSGNKELHVTSAHFDDPLAVQMAERHHYILALHGYEEPSLCRTLVGGTDHKRARIFAEALHNHGFSAELLAAGAHLSGTNPASINNRCKTGLSVQLEISTAQRKAMFGRFSLKGREASKNEVFFRYIAAIKEGIENAYR
ncbi:poly-gamma-glutamate hydrolase family protein [Bacillus sonorensis]|uniref:poly-gamma-glutamate hydrolase family protein n=1 Tax=Bacillus sonorensis TaxID=119858 RepID=UPI00098A839C|nr:poly-gamma-glutamate hydrolase family protein [Bacillus sonorensis]